MSAKVDTSMIDCKALISINKIKSNFCNKDFVPTQNKETIIFFCK